MTKINNAISRQHRLIAPLIFTFLIWTIISVDSVQAQDWGFDPVIRIGAEVDDNALLKIRTDEEIRLEGYLLEGSFGIDYASPRTLFSVTPVVLLRRYPDFDGSGATADNPNNLDFESNDYFLWSTFGHEMRSSSIGLRLNYERQQIRTAERAGTDRRIEDPEDILDDDTGRVALEGTRERWRVAPSWGYKFTDKSSIAAELDYRNIHFDKVLVDLQDWEDTRANLSYRYALSNINTAVLTATGRHYETIDTGNELDGYGLLAGFDRSVSEKTRLRAMAGVEITEPAAAGAENFTNIVGNISLTQKLETIRMLAQYRRAVVGSGLGTLTIRDSLYFQFTRSLNERISAALGIRAYHDEGLSDSSNLDRDYIQLRSVFSWYLSKAFSLEFDYRYTVINRENFGERSNSNNVRLWFVYQPNRIPE